MTDMAKTTKHQIWANLAASDCKLLSQILGCTGSGQLLWVITALPRLLVKKTELYIKSKLDSAHGCSVSQHGPAPRRSDSSRQTALPRIALSRDTALNLGSTSTSGSSDLLGCFRHQRNARNLTSCTGSLQR